MESHLRYPRAKRQDRARVISRGKTAGCTTTKPGVLWELFPLCARWNFCKDFGAANCMYGRWKCGHAANRRVDRTPNNGECRVRFFATLLLLGLVYCAVRFALYGNLLRG